MSWNYTEGAVVALDMVEYERERDQCPLHFDDGQNPWLDDEATNIIFNWQIWKSAASSLSTSLFLGIILVVVSLV